jgi:hypothetical protein
VETNPRDLFIPLILHRDEVAFAYHLRLFGTNPVRDEAPVLFGFAVVRALVARRIESGELAR